MLVKAKSEKTPGVNAKYMLIGNDHKNAINRKTFLIVKVAPRARSAGNNNIMNVRVNISEVILTVS